MISDDMYDDEDWAIVARKAGFNPVDTESSARMAFRYCAPIIKSLYEALSESCDHHDYCEWGDRWERERAIYSGLIDRVDKAVQEGKDIFGEIER